jgi:hypothetical protein
VTTTQDCSIGLAVESTYGTSVTPTRFPEFVSETLDYRKNIVQGKGLRVGSRVARSGRRVVTTADAGGDIMLECVSKGMGLIWQACLGSGVSTLVPASSAYQQVFTLGDTPSSLTVQKGLPQVGGTVDAYTFLGAMVDSWEFTFGNADIPTLKMTLDCKDVTTATAYAAPSYVAGANLFSFAGASLSTGTLTAPTTTVLGSGATSVANVRGGSIQVANNLRGDRYNIGGAGRKAMPTVGMRDITGRLEVEYDSTTFRDAVLNETPMSLVLTYTGAALSPGNETLQVILPEIKLDGELPKSNGGELITQSMAFAGLDNLTAAQPIWVVTRTADIAL